ncbi:MAG TPA: PIN domain-containing protein [candidate division Zixibacteria bacterium]|nr:PIN domain-containing protein [candidate division Zixibacteria bacterium]
MIFLDANIFIDHLGKGEYWQDNYVIFEEIQKTKGEYFASALSIVFTHMHFFKFHNKDSKNELDELLKGISIVSLTNECLQQAMEDLSFDDFEDCVQYYSAKSAGCQTIITRNPCDFKSVSDKIEILKPREFVQKKGLVA